MGDKNLITSHVHFCFHSRHQVKEISYLIQNNIDKYLFANFCER